MEWYTVLTKIYNYNQTLPPDDRLVFFCPDEVRPGSLFFYSLLKILDDKELPDTLVDYRSYFEKRYQAIRERIDSIKKSNTYYYDKLSEYWIQQVNNKNDLLYIKEIQSEIVNNDKYKEILGDDYFYFTLIIDKCLITAQHPAQKVPVGEYYQVREKHTYETFKKLYQQLPKGKMYGQWGTSHIYQSAYPAQTMNAGIDWFATLLNQQDSPFHDKILSIHIFYSKDTESYDLFLTTFLALTSRSRCTLYRLNGKNSPFLRESFMMHKFDDSIVTTDYFQYAIYVNYE